MGGKSRGLEIAVKGVVVVGPQPASSFGRPYIDNGHLFFLSFQSLATEALAPKTKCFNLAPAEQKSRRISNSQMVETEMSDRVLKSEWTLSGLKAYVAIGRPLLTTFHQIL